MDVRRMSGSLMWLNMLEAPESPAGRGNQDWNAITGTEDWNSDSGTEDWN